MNSIDTSVSLLSSLVVSDCSKPFVPENLAVRNAFSMEKSDASPRERFTSNPPLKIQNREIFYVKWLGKISWAYSTEKISIYHKNLNMTLSYHGWILQSSTSLVFCFFLKPAALQITLFKIFLCPVGVHFVSTVNVDIFACVNVCTMLTFWQIHG